MRSGAPQDSAASDDGTERGLSRRRWPRPRRRTPLVESARLAPPIRPSHWGSAAAARRIPGVSRLGERGERGKRGAVPLQSLLGSHLELLCALQKCPLLPLLLSLPLATPLLSPPCRGSSLCRGRSPPRPTTTRTTPATRGAAAAAATTRHK